MIFVSGIHGVGKSYFCQMIKNKLGFNSYSASQMITIRRSKGFSEDKRVSDIDDNQSFLIEAVNEIRERESEFILDGHLCLLDADGKVTRISVDTFKVLRPDYIVLLTEKPEIIAERRFKRDGVQIDEAEIAVFQDEEIKYAEEITAQFNIPLIVSNGAEGLEQVIMLLNKGGK